MLEDFFWSAMNQGIAIGENTQANTFRYQELNSYPLTITSGGVYTILDTGLSTIMISNIYFDELLKYIY